MSFITLQVLNFLCHSLYTFQGPSFTFLFPSTLKKHACHLNVMYYFRVSLVKHAFINFVLTLGMALLTCFSKVLSLLHSYMFNHIILSKLVSTN